MVKNVRIISVEIVPGKSLCSWWKSDMQRISTDSGVYIDRLLVDGGHDWKQESGKSVEVEISSDKYGNKWISPKKNSENIKKPNFSNMQIEKLPPDYDINKNPELVKVYDYIKQDVPVIFLTGGAGTGKSTFIKFLKKNLTTDTGKNYVILAPTGVAAINVGGQTIHSFFHWNTDVFEDKEVTIGKYRNPIVDHTDLFIIDEISMVHSWMIDHIDYALRLWCDRTKPFGGKQLLLIGDCFQLPPVKNDDDKEKQKYYERWESSFFFAAKAFEHFSQDEIKSVQLTKIYRQENDQQFIHILNRIRRCKPGYKEDIDYLNDNCFIETRLGTKNVPVESLLLCATNNKADEFNNKRMYNLQQNGAKSITFKASVEGEFKKASVLTPESLEICVGAKIMVTKNINSLGLVNGDMGTVIGFGGTGNGADDYVDIENKERKYHITRETWQSLKYKWDENTKTITQQEVGTFNQIPLKLGWAVTIHKSQGLTLDSVAIDAPEAWDSGQIYVALSRAKTLNGILLCHKIPVSAIKVDAYVQKKYQELFPEEDEHSSNIQDDHKAVLTNESFTVDKSLEKTSVMIGGMEFELYPKSGEKIQDHVKGTMKLLLENNLIPESEMHRLLNDNDYCYETFGIYYKFPSWTLKLPLLTVDRDNNENKKRYWANNYNGYYICSQWYQNCSEKFKNWLLKLSK